MSSRYYASSTYSSSSSTRSSSEDKRQAPEPKQRSEPVREERRRTQQVIIDYPRNNPNARDTYPRRTKGQDGGFHQ